MRSYLVGFRQLDDVDPSHHSRPFMRASREGSGETVLAWTFPARIYVRYIPNNEAMSHVFDQFIQDNLKYGTSLVCKQRRT